MIITEITFYSGRSATIPVKLYPGILSAVSYQAFTTIFSTLRIRYLTEHNTFDSMENNSHLNTALSEYRRHNTLEIKVFDIKRYYHIDEGCTEGCPSGHRFECYRPPGAPLNFILGELQHEQGQNELNTTLIANKNKLGIFIDYRMIFNDNRLLSFYGCYEESGGEGNDVQLGQVLDSQTVSDKDLERALLSTIKSIREKFRENLEIDPELKNKNRFGLLGVFQIGILPDNIEEFDEKLRQLFDLLRIIIGKALDNDVQTIVADSASSNVGDIPTYWIDLELLEYICRMKQKLEEKKKDIRYSLYLYFPSNVERYIFYEPLTDVLKRVFDEFRKRYEWAKTCKLEFKSYVVGGLMNFREVLKDSGTNLFFTLDPIAVFSPWAETRRLVLGGQREEPEFKEDEILILQYAKPYICLGTCLYSRLEDIVKKNGRSSNPHIEELDDKTKKELIEESLKSPLLAVTLPEGRQSDRRGQDQVIELSKYKDFLPYLQEVLPIDVETAEGRILIRAVGPDIVLSKKDYVYAILDTLPDTIISENEFRRIVNVNDQECLAEFRKAARKCAWKKAISVSRERTRRIFDRLNII